MSEQIYRKEDIVLVETKINETFSAPAKLPVDLDNFKGLKAQGVIRGVVAVVSLSAGIASLGALIGPAGLVFLPGWGVFAGIAGSNVDGSIDQAIMAANTTLSALQGLSFKEYEKNLVQIKLIADVVVLKRQDGSLDVVLTHNVTYTTAYNILPPYDGDGSTQASLYRDRATFFVKPREPIGMDLDKVAPSTKIKETHYSFQTSWGIGGGISGSIGAKVGDQPEATGSVGFNANGSYSFSSGTSMSKEDFALEKLSGKDGVEEAVMWAADLGIVRENYGKEPFDYSPDNPAMIVRSKRILSMTNWISTPPKTATGDLDLPFLTCFHIPANTLTSDLIKIDIAATQKLPHAVSLGRWGAPKARMGGQPFILNNSFDAAGTIVIDLKTKTARLENKIGAFKTPVEKAQEVSMRATEMKMQREMAKHR